MIDNKKVRGRYLSLIKFQTKKTRRFISKFISKLRRKKKKKEKKIRS